MRTPTALTLALPCPRCSARAGDPCVRRDGGPLKGSHVKRTPPAPCGSNGGYVRHIRDKEEPCEPCRDARRRYMQEYRNRRPDVRAKDMAQLLARREATKRLIERHRAEFQQLLREVAS